MSLAVQIPQASNENDQFGIHLTSVLCYPVLQFISKPFDLIDQIAGC
jgi:hypothetical protein